MERETKSITTPSGTEVVLNTYINGREKRDINSASMGANVSISPDGTISGVDGAMISRRQDAAISAVVVSVAGSKENILNTVLDLKASDYDAVIEAVNEVTGDADFAKKKVS